MPSTRHPGRPPANLELGTMTNAERQRWYRIRRTRQQRDMAALLMDLWEQQPVGWREEHEYRHRDVLALAYRLAAQPKD